jgi:SAM-dependent methyltransferase
VTNDKRGQVLASAAEVYDEFFVPALFAQWPAVVADAAGIGPGQSVLDVACGTGVLARAVKERVGPDGRVTGLDPNEGMLDVASHAAPDIEWRHGRGEELPFGDGTFDAVVSQFGLMFFDDRAAGVAEMRRVLRPGGRLALAVWSSIERCPGYAALQSLVVRLFGADVGAAIGYPFALGDPAELTRLLDAAELGSVAVRRHAGVARFQSIDAWMFTEIRGWTLAGAVDDAGFDRLLAEAKRELAGFELPDGRVEFPVEALVATAST